MSVDDILLAGLAAVCAFGLVRATVAIGVPHLYGNEGWNAYHTAAAMAGHPYPASGSLVVNNYPPLSFYIVGAFAVLTGDPILAGRLVSLLSFLVIVVATGRCVRALGGSMRSGIFAACMVMAFLLFDSDYVGVNDPQLLGQAFQMGGLALLFRRPRPGSRRHLALAAALMVVGLFVKHNLIALPLAASLWLIAVDRRRGLVFAGIGIALSLAGAGLFQLLAHRTLWGVLNQPRVWSLAFAINGFGGRLPELILPVVATAVLVHHHRDSRLVFAAVYLAVALVLAFWFFGGAGCSGNVIFDGFIALGMCGGLALSRSRKAAVCWLVSVIGMLVFHAATGSFKPRYWLQPSAPAVTDAVSDATYLAAADGPVLVKDLGLSWRAGKPAAMDLWGYEQAVATGARDGHELIEAIAAQRYRVLQLGASPNALAAPPEIPRAYAHAVSRTILAHYRVDHSDTNGTFWVPR